MNVGNDTFRAEVRAFLAKNLPVAANGKVLKHKLAEIFAHQLIGAVIAKQTGT